jgi:hypothetical protein
VLYQDNPVSNTLYTVLDTTPNLQLESLSAYVNWATTQPTNLRVIVTVDGVVKTFIFASPTSSSSYFPKLAPWAADSAQELALSLDILFDMALKACSGRSVKIQIAITWQPHSQLR